MASNLARKSNTDLDFFNDNERAPTRKGGRKAVAKPKQRVRGLEELAAIRAIIAAAQSVEETLAAEVKDELTKTFADAKLMRGERPSSFNGYEGDGEGNCQLKTRSSASALSEADEKFLRRYRIPTVEVESMPTTFIFNPDYTDLSVSANKRLFAEINAALKSIRNVDVPRNLIQKQVGEVKVIVGENALNKVFEEPSAAVRERLIKIVGTIAVRTKWDGNFAGAWQRIKSMMKPIKEEERKVIDYRGKGRR